MLTITTALYVGISASLALVNGNDFHHPNATPETDVSIHDTGFACLALTAFAEARNQGPTGMALVVETIINRVEHSKFPTGPCEVVTAPGQFAGIYTWQFPREPWNVDQESWLKALAVTQAVIDGSVSTPVECSGSTHFLNPDIMAKFPRWTKNHPDYKPTCRFNNHQFYKQEDPNA